MDVRRTLLVAVPVLLAFALVSFGTIVSESEAQAGDIRICHSTSSVTNPYESITVAISAADGISDGPGQPDHFLAHTGGLFDPENPPTPPISDEEEWGD